MVRFLVILTSLFACLVGCALLASRFTITVTVRPVEAAPVSAPIPAEPAPIEQPAKQTTAPKRVDSHHTHGA